MIKQEILEKHLGPNFIGENTTESVLAAMEEYAKSILEWILDASEDGIGGDPMQRIEMVGRNFFYEDDKEGDMEMDAEKIIELYEKNNNPKIKIERIEPTKDFNSSNSRHTRVCFLCDGTEENGHEAWCPEKDNKI